MWNHLLPARTVSDGQRAHKIDYRPFARHIQSPAPLLSLAARLANQLAASRSLQAGAVYSKAFFSFFLDPAWLVSSNHHAVSCGIISTCWQQAVAAVAAVAAAAVAAALSASSLTWTLVSWHKFLCHQHDSNGFGGGCARLAGRRFASKVKQPGKRRRRI